MERLLGPVLHVVGGLSARQVGLLLGVAGVAGVDGSPIAGWLAGRLPTRTLLIGCHLVGLEMFPRAGVHGQRMASAPRPFLGWM